MSCRRRCDPPEELPEFDVEPSELDVEYFVEVLEEDDVCTSVPNSVQSSHTSSSAPSTLTVFGFAVSAPHISHWTMRRSYRAPRINYTPPVVRLSTQIAACAPEPLDGGEMADDREDSEQPRNERVAANTRDDGGDDADDADKHESIGTPEQAAVLAAEPDRLYLRAEIRREEDAGDGRESEAPRPYARGETGEHGDVRVPVEDVIEQVAAVGGDRGLARHRAIEQVEAAVTEDEDGADDVPDGRRESERARGGERESEGENAYPVGRQPEADGRAHERVERAVGDRAQAVEGHSRYPVKSTSPALGSRSPRIAASTSAATASGVRSVVSTS